MNTPIKSKNHIYIYIYIWLAFLLLILSSCTDAGVESGASKSTSVDVRTITYTGYIIDSAVEGLGYLCENDLGKSSTGKTNAEGLFEYPGLSSCKLSLGQVTLGSFSPSGTTSGIFQNYYSPYDIWPDAPLKAAAFLQTLDDNTNASDGIKIPVTISGDAATVTGEIVFDVSLDLSTDTVVTALRTAHGSNPAVVAENTAETNMRSGIIEAAIQKFARKYISTGAKLNYDSLANDIFTIRIGSKEVAIKNVTSSDTSCVATDGSIGDSPCKSDMTASVEYDTANKTHTWTAYAGSTTEVGPFVLFREYVTQHVYFVNVIAQEAMEEEISFVVSESNTAPTLSSVDSIAKHSRKFKYGDADLNDRPVYIAWDSTLTTANYKTFLKGLDNTSYNAASHPWILEAGKSYNLYIYKGTQTYKHGFTTLGYKTTLKAYTDALPGVVSQFQYNNGIDRASLKGHIERKDTEPLVHNVLFGPGVDTKTSIGFLLGNTIIQACISGICGSGSLVRFGSGFLTSYILGVRQVDLLYFIPNYNDDGSIKTLTSPGKFESDLNGLKNGVSFKTVTE